MYILPLFKNIHENKNKKSIPLSLAWLFAGDSSSESDSDSDSSSDSLDEDAYLVPLVPKESIFKIFYSIN